MIKQVLDMTMKYQEKVEYDNSGDNTKKYFSYSKNVKNYL